MNEGMEVTPAGQPAEPALDIRQSETSASSKTVSQDILLATYVEQISPSNFTEQAKAALLSELKQYSQDLCTVTRLRRRADRNAEKALRNHVEDSAAFLRNKQDDLIDTIADWSKWIGFTFVGFAVQQWIHVRGEKPIVSGSVTWLVVDVVVAAVLIVAGFVIDKPWGYFSGIFRRS